jgi:DNA modification methylase
MPPALSRGISVVRGDWLDLARALPPLSIDLLYADPPFNTGKRRTGTRGSRSAYADRWSSAHDHAAWLRERLAATLPALRPGANLLVHCDYRSSHRVRLVLEELLGESGFVNHIIWSYGLGGSSPRCFAKKHDDILWFTRDPRGYFFDPPMVPATSRRMHGKHKKATDVLAIPSINNMAGERTGYPTQKPLALLTLLLRACCPPGGAVLDPCCGSGTTLVAARRLGLRGVGFDSSAAAVRTARARLSALERE